MRELWPDNAADRAEILRWFGADSLDWWNPLSVAEQERRTLARGLSWAASFTTTQLQDRIQDELLEIVECNHVSFINQNDQTWCRWEPTRSGFYLLVGEGAWQVKFRAGRSWSTAQINAINTHLQNPTNRTRVVTNLNRLNRNRNHRWGLPVLTFADLGLEEVAGEPVNTLPLPSDLDEHLFTASPTDLTGCPPIDLRVSTWHRVRRGQLHRD